VSMEIQATDGLSKEVSETFLLITLAGSILGGYVGLALVVVQALR